MLVVVLIWSEFTSRFRCLRVLEPVLVIAFVRVAVIADLLCRREVLGFVRVRCAVGERAQCLTGPHKESGRDEE